MHNVLSLVRGIGVGDASHIQILVQDLHGKITYVH